MPEYSVTLRSKVVRWHSAEVNVEAANKREAQRLALEQSDRVEWEDFCDDMCDPHDELVANATINSIERSD